MKQIQTVQAWKDGETKSANNLDLRIIHDDLETSATFYYELKDVQVSEETTTQTVVAVGNVSLSGDEYASWGSTDDINTEAYNIVASKLNLTIV